MMAYLTQYQYPNSTAQYRILSTWYGTCSVHSTTPARPQVVLTTVHSTCVGHFYGEWSAVMANSTARASADAICASWLVSKYNVTEEEAAAGCADGVRSRLSSLKLSRRVRHATQRYLHHQRRQRSKNGDGGGGGGGGDGGGGGGGGGDAPVDLNGSGLNRTNGSGATGRRGRRRRRRRLRLHPTDNADLKHQSEDGQRIAIVDAFGLTDGESKCRMNMEGDGMHFIGLVS